MNEDRMGTTVRDLMLRIESEPRKKGVEEEEEVEGADDQSGGSRLDGPADLPMERCRICACRIRVGAKDNAAGGGDVEKKKKKEEEEEVAVCIFDAEGCRRDLRGNIQKYLHITVSSEDSLPKMVCASCLGKLEGIHAFATMALRSQEKLKQELLKDSSVIVDSSDSSDSCANKLGDRGLLHSILTKGSIDTSNDGESLQGRQRTPSTEEMEVKVDPMLFLQYAFEQASSVDYSDYSDDSDREVSSYCSPNSEPLSLTNKTTRSKKESKPITEESLSKSRDSNDNENNPRVSESSEQKRNQATDDHDYYDDEDDYEEDNFFDDTSKGSLKAHTCKVCAKPFASQLALQNHLWSHLPTTTTSAPGNSDDKDSTMQQDAALQSNGCSENNLLGLATFICPICGKKISTKGNLKVHLETHRPKGKYGCDICGRIFKTQSNLFRHKEYHSNVQFPCSVCGRVYPTNSTLRAHSITHSDLRPHACPLCDKTFKRNQDLKFHINQHTGARPYQCPYCPKAFASSGNCFSHRKRMHPKEVNRDRQRAADLMR